MFYITTFSEQKHRGVPTPIQRSRKPMPVEITTFRVAFVHTLYNLTYKMREPIFSLLRIYTITQVLSSCYSVDFSKSPFGIHLTPLSPKVLNQTNNGKPIYIKKDYNYKDYFFLFYLYFYIYINTITTKESYNGSII